MAWYGTGRHPTKVHSSPSCARLVRGAKHPVVELDEDTFQVNRLCKECFSGQVSSLHVRCSVCAHKTVRPCPHNGGVVVQGRTRLLWVWPEDALGRTLVNPMQPV
jgi:hypothetical protein